MLKEPYLLKKQAFKKKAITNFPQLFGVIFMNLKAKVVAQIVLSIAYNFIKN